MCWKLGHFSGCCPDIHPSLRPLLYRSVSPAHHKALLAQEDLEPDPEGWYFTPADHVGGGNVKLASAYFSAVRGELCRAIFWVLRQAKKGHTAHIKEEDFMDKGVVILHGPQCLLAWDVSTADNGARCGVSRRWRQTAANFHEVILRRAPYTAVACFRTLLELLSAGISVNTPPTTRSKREPRRNVSGGPAVHPAPERPIPLHENALIEGALGRVTGRVLQHGPKGGWWSVLTDAGREELEQRPKASYSGVRCPAEDDFMEVGRRLSPTPGDPASSPVVGSGHIPGQEALGSVKNDHPLVQKIGLFNVSRVAPPGLAQDPEKRSAQLSADCRKVCGGQLNIPAPDVIGGSEKPAVRVRL